MKYLVTSASGDLASKAVSYLEQLVPVTDIAVTVRNEEKGRPFSTRGLDTRIADYFDKDALIQAFQGIDRVLFISSGALEERALQHQYVVEALVEAGVSFVAYTSVINAQHSHALVAPDHQATEKLLAASGLDYTLLRNNWYLENEAATLKTAKDTHTLTHASGEGRVGWALKDDYAKAAARVLAGVAPKKDIYELTGKNRTYAELAQLLQQATQEDIAVVNVPLATYTEELAAKGLPEGAVGFISGVQRDIQQGELAFDSNDLELALGHPQTDFNNYLLSL